MHTGQRAGDEKLEDSGDDGCEDELEEIINRKALVRMSVSSPLGRESRVTVQSNSMALKPNSGSH